MSPIIAAAYILLVAAMGYAILSALFGPSRWDWAGLTGFSFGVGLGAIGVVLFVFSLAGMPPGLGVVVGIGVTVLLTLVVLSRLGRLLRIRMPAPFRPARATQATIAIIAGLVIVFATANVVTETVVSGVSAVDAFAIWMFKARIVATEPLRPIPAVLLDPTLSYSHQDYPLGFPFAVAGMYAAIGAQDAQIGKLILVGVYVALSLVSYAALRRMVRRPTALAITALFVSMPVLVQHAGMAVAEVPLVFLHTCCLAMLLRWMQSGDRRDLVLSAAFAAFAAFTKNEGLALVPLVALSAIAFAATARNPRRCFLDLAIASAIAVALLTPWLIYRCFLPRTHEDYGGKLTSVATIAHDLPRLSRILPQYLGLLIQPTTAGGIWVVLGVAAVVGLRQFARPPVLALWGLLLAHLGLYAATFMVTPWELNLLLPMVGAKLIMHAAPTAALLIGLHLSGGDESPKQTPALIGRPAARSSPTRPTD